MPGNPCLTRPPLCLPTAAERAPWRMTSRQVRARRPPIDCRSALSRLRSSAVRHGDRPCLSSATSGQSATTVSPRSRTACPTGTSAISGPGRASRSTANVGDAVRCRCLPCGAAFPVGAEPARSGMELSALHAPDSAYRWRRCRSQPAYFAVDLWHDRCCSIWRSDRCGCLPCCMSAVLASPAVFINAMFGQNGALTAALLIGGLLMPRRSGLILAGILFGLLTIKPHLGILVPFCLIASRNWRACLSAPQSAAAVLADGDRNLSSASDVWASLHRARPASLMTAITGGALSAILSFERADRVRHGEGGGRRPRHRLCFASRRDLARGDRRGDVALASLDRRSTHRRRALAHRHAGRRRPRPMPIATTRSPCASRSPTCLPSRQGRDGVSCSRSRGFSRSSRTC